MLVPLHHSPSHIYFGFKQPCSNWSGVLREAVDHISGSMKATPHLLQLGQSEFVLLLNIKSVCAEHQSVSNATVASARGANEWDDIFESPWRFQRVVTQGTLTTHFFLNQSYTVLSIHLFSNTRITNLSVQSPAGIWQQETNCREFQLMVINKLGYKDQRQWMVWDGVLCVLFKNERLALKLYY